jgi:predicted MFS family arabinose efflux permease
LVPPPPPPPPTHTKRIKHPKIRTLRESVPIKQEPITEIKTNQPVSLWRNRDYVLLVSGQVVSLIGSQFSLIAFPLLALFISGSPAQAGLIGSTRLLPYFLLSLPAGALADRWDRKRVMQICDAGRALSLASIPIAFALGHLTLLQLYLVSLIEGTLFVFFDLAEVACLPQVVGKEQIVSATTQNEVARNIGFLLGPALGGAVYSLGKFVPFLLDSISYLASILSLSWMRAKFQQERAARPEKLWTEIRAGLLWMWHQPLIFFIALTGTLYNLFFDGIVLLVIVLGQQMHATPFMIGLVLAMDGVGSMIGTVLLDRFQRQLSFRAAYIGGHWLWAVFWFLILFARNMLVLAVIVGLIYVVLMIADLVQFSYRRVLIPDELQGRVNSVFRLISYSGRPLSLGLTGFLLQFYGPYPTVIILGIGAAATALLITLNPHIWRARPLSEILREQGGK